MGSGLGLAAGYSGILSKQVNDIESGNRSLQVLGALEAKIEQDRKESLAFQEMEAAEYAQIQKQASTLLERDRQKINAKAIALASGVQDEVAQFGSRKKYYTNGGLAQIKKYKSDLLGSDEMASYETNKVNMERILQVQAAGKGHLLAPKDIKNLQEYQNGTADKITYSGLMSELDYSIASLYPLGVEVPKSALLHYNDNFARTYASYVAENGPDSLKGMDDKAIEQELMGFMVKMKYGTLGKDDFYRQEEALLRRQQRAQQQERAAKSGTPEQAPQLFSAVLNQEMDNSIYQKGIGIDQLLTTTDDKGNVVPADYLIRNSNETLRGLGFKDVTSAWKERFKPTVTKSGSYFSGLSQQLSSKYFEPASALKLNIPKSDLAKVALMDGINPDGTVNYTMTTDFYNANGQKFEKGDVDDYAGGNQYNSMDTKGKATILGAFMGFRTADGKILMNVVDKNGKIRKDDNLQNRTAYDKGTPSHSVFIAMKDDESGQVFYREADMASALGQTTFNNNVKDNNITSVVKSQGQASAQSKAAQEEIDFNKKAIGKEVLTSSNSTRGFASPAYTYEAQSFTDSQGNSRNNEQKAFYMAFDAMTNGTGQFSANSIENSGEALQGRFTYMLQSGKLRDEVMDYKNYPGQKFIDHFVQTQNADLEANDPSIEQNSKFGQLWLSYYKFLQNNK